MKHVLIISSFLFLFSVNSIAQYSWGISTKLGITSYIQNDQIGNPSTSTSPLIGGSIGLFYTKNIAPRIHIRTEFSALLFRGREITKSSEKTYWMPPYNEILVHTHKTDDYNTLYLTAPLILETQLRRWSIGIGIQTGIRVFDQVHTFARFRSPTYGYNPDPESYRLKNQINATFDFGPRLDFGYQINPKFDLRLNLYKGLISVKNDELNKKALSVLFALNYRIGSNLALVEPKIKEKRKKRGQGENDKKRKFFNKRKFNLKPLLRTHVDFGISPTSAFRFLKENPNSHEKLILTSSFGFTMSNDCKQPIFIEMGLNYNSLGKNTWTQNASSVYTQSRIERWNSVTIPLTLGINIKSFTFNIGLSCSKLANVKLKVVEKTSSGGTSTDKYVEFTGGKDLFQIGPLVKFGYQLSSNFNLNAKYQYNALIINQSHNLSLGLSYAFKK